ncbi:HCO3 transporter family-domain-containing protein, partial [Phakopsora pachyrhizi]
PWSQRSWSYQNRPFRGIYYDLKRRIPLYKSDWTLAFKKENLYRVTAATVRMYFINLMPALAYMIDMNDRTNGFYGINEASALAAIVFPLIGAQPLTIVGVTGLINLFNYTNYDIATRDNGVNYLQFQAWVLIWAALFHFLMAIFNLCDFTRFITDMTSETFGLYVGVIYIQKGIELIVREFDRQAIDGWLSVVVAMLFTLCVYWTEKGSRKGFGPLWARKFFEDYAFVFATILFTGFVHIPGYLKSADLLKLPITRSWHPTVDRDWVVDFWNLNAKWVFVALPLGFLLTLLFYFDHNVSSLMAQASQFPVERPAGFHWDFFILGVTTLISGILGLPAPNGLVPQAPVHTESLSVVKLVSKDLPEKNGIVSPKRVEEDRARRRRARVGEGSNGLLGEQLVECKVVRTRVAEQRVSHLGIGLLTLGTMTRPLLVTLGTMPRALFAGIFISVGWGSIEGNGIVENTLYLLRDPNMTPPDHKLNPLKKKVIIKFISIQWFIFTIMVAISQTIAAIGFPLVIIALIPIRYYYGPRWFSPYELSLLDSPTANAPGVMASIGGDLARVTGDGFKVAPDTGFLGTLADSSATTTNIESQKLVAK